jgi:membrane protein DedA with SNARE-associated domain
VLLEDFGVPLPGETILIAAAVYAGAGRLNIVVLGMVAVAAAVLGDNIGFAIGHFGGRPLVEKYGKYALLTRARLDHAEQFVRRHGGWIVTLVRFVEGLRQANGIVAGIARLPWQRTFLPFNVLGAVLWVGLDHRRVPRRQPDRPAVRQVPALRALPGHRRWRTGA